MTTATGDPSTIPGPGPGPDVRRAQAAAAVAALTAALAGPLAAAWARLQAVTDRITATWLDEPPAVRARRARVIATTAAAVLPGIDAALDADTTRAVHAVYTAASAAAATDVGVTWAEGRVDVRVLDRLAADLTADLRQATAYTLTTARALSRQIERLATIAGPHVEQAAALTRVLQDRGLAAVVYRDGSRHGLEEYATMAVRTKLAQTWQVAGMRLMGAAGVTYVELADGPSCGLTSHQDPDKADGAIITLDLAEAYPLAHPRCQRVSYPRPDVRTPDDAAAAPRLGRRSSPDVGGGAPSTRDGSGLLDVRSPALLSPAAGRHATSVARALARTVPAAGVVVAALRRRATPAQGPGQPS